MPDPLGLLPPLAPLRIPQMPGLQSPQPLGLLGQAVLQNMMNLQSPRAGTTPQQATQPAGTTSGGSSPLATLGKVSGLLGKVAKPAINALTGAATGGLDGVTAGTVAGDPLGTGALTNTAPDILTGGGVPLGAASDLVGALGPGTDPALANLADMGSVVSPAADAASGAIGGGLAGSAAGAAPAILGLLTSLMGGDANAARAISSLAGVGASALGGATGAIGGLAGVAIPILMSMIPGMSNLNETQAQKQRREYGRYAGEFPGLVNEASMGGNKIAGLSGMDWSNPTPDQVHQLEQAYMDSLVATRTGGERAAAYSTISGGEKHAGIPGKDLSQYAAAAPALQTADWVQGLVSGDMLARVGGRDPLTVPDWYQGSPYDWATYMAYDPAQGESTRTGAPLDLKNAIRALGPYALGVDPSQFTDAMANDLIKQLPDNVTPGNYTSTLVDIFNKANPNFGSTPLAKALMLPTMGTPTDTQQANMTQSLNLMPDLTPPAPADTMGLMAGMSAP